MEEVKVDIGLGQEAMLSGAASLLNISKTEELQLDLEEAMGTATRFEVEEAGKGGAKVRARGRASMHNSRMMRLRRLAWGMRYRPPPIIRDVLSVVNTAAASSLDLFIFHG